MVRDLKRYEEPRLAKTLRKSDLDNEGEVVDMEDEKDEDLAEAVCMISGGAVLGGRRRICGTRK